MNEIFDRQKQISEFYAMKPWHVMNIVRNILEIYVTLLEWQSKDSKTQFTLDNEFV